MAYCPPETRMNPEGSETRYENEEEIVRLHDDFKARLGSKSLNEKEVVNLQDHLKTYFKVSTLSEEEIDLLHLAYKSQLERKRLFEEIRAQSNVLFEKNVLQDKSKLLHEWKMLIEVMKAIHDKLRVLYESKGLRPEGVFGVQAMIPPLFGSKHIYVDYLDFLSPNTNLLFGSKFSYEVKSVVENRVSIRPYPIDRNNVNRKETLSAICFRCMSPIYSSCTTTEDSCQSSTKGSSYTTNDNNCQSSTNGSRYTTNDNSCQSSTKGSSHTTNDNNCQSSTNGSRYTTNDNSCQSSTKSSRYTTNDNSCQSSTDGSRYTTNDNSCQSSTKGSRYTTNDNSRQSSTDGSRYTTNDNSCQSSTHGSRYTTHDNSCQSSTKGSRNTTNDNSCQSSTQGSRYTTNDYICQSSTDGSRHTTTEDSCQSSTDGSRHTTTEDSCQSSTDGARHTTTEDSCQSSTDGSRHTTTEDSCQSSTDGSKHTTTEDSCQSLTLGSTYTTIDDNCQSLDALQDDKETTDILECSGFSTEFKEDVTNNTRLKTLYYPTRHKTTEQDGTVDANESGTRSLRKEQRADNKANFIYLFNDGISSYPSKVNVQQRLDLERASLPGGFKKENMPVKFIIGCLKQTPLEHPFSEALVKQEKYWTTMKNKENNQSIFGITERLSRLLSPKCDSLTSTEFSLSDGSELLAVGPEEWPVHVQIHYKSMESSRRNALEYLKTVYRKLSEAKMKHNPITIGMLRTAATLAGGDIAAMFCEGSNSEPQTIRYVLTFPDDCRMAISVPTISGSFLHAKDELDRADFSRRFNSL